MESPFGVNPYQESPVTLLLSQSVCSLPSGRTRPSTVLPSLPPTDCTNTSALTRLTARPLMVPPVWVIRVGAPPAVLTFQTSLNGAVSWFDVK